LRNACFELESSVSTVVSFATGGFLSGTLISLVWTNS